MKRFFYLLAIFTICLLPSYKSFASDNVFVGMGDVEEVFVDYDRLVSGINLGSYKDGDMTEDELDFSRVQKIFIDTFPSIFEEEKINADALKYFLNNSNYVYYMPINRPHESLFLTIAKGLEVTEEDYKYFEEVGMSDEEIAEAENDAGHWIITEVGLYDELQDASMDYMGLMESYLEYKNIHNAEVYFASNINPKSMITGIVFTGKQTESGEDEIIFVAVDTLQYDEAGNLISIDKYALEDDGDYEIEDAEYTYEELRELSKNINLDPELSGGGGSTSKRIPYGVYIAIAAGAIIIAGVIIFVRKRAQR